MEFLKGLIATGASFLFLMLVFIPMERVFPANPQQKFFRPKWIVDFCFFAGQYLLWNSLVLGGLDYLNQYIVDFIPTQMTTFIQSQPWWLQAIEVVVFSDIVIYWGHRLQHRVEFLWRFHKVHHSSEHLDWLAAHREHPLDSIYTIGLINLPAVIMGFPLETLAGVIAFRGIWAIYIHSNVRIPLGPLHLLFGAPQLHHWHHAKDRDIGNYANISPLMDVIFGTHVHPDHEPASMGISEKFPKSYLGQLIVPLLPKKIGDKWKEL